MDANYATKVMLWTGKRERAARNWKWLQILLFSWQPRLLWNFAERKSGNRLVIKFTNVNWMLKIEKNCN